ncbi:MAG: putative 4-hydroxybenzoate polyprenyltransferase [Bacteroidetes bacterium]|nr:putative 4-hydroxybenzoate polyprenyltransferase [Bacteroidota bacterium]
MSELISSIRTFGSLIKFSHTVFALPFAMISLVLASYDVPFALIFGEKLLWIVLAMVGARSAAMGFNRVVDADYDKNNPRTSMREIPAGKISVQTAWIFISIASVLFVFSAWKLNELCFYLSPVALAVIFFYSLTKRFTWAAHLFLGLGIGLAPVGAWLAITGEFDWVPVLLGFAVTVWIAGFDIIYACQDVNFDREVSLKSIPVRFGIEHSLLFARMLHGIMVLIMISVGLLVPSGWIYFAGMITLVILLTIEHRIVNPKDLSKINIAFFHLNSAISVVLFFFILADRLIS